MTQKDTLPTTPEEWRAVLAGLREEYPSALGSIREVEKRIEDLVRGRR